MTQTEKDIIKRYIELTVLQVRNQLTLEQHNELYHIKEHFKNDIARIKEAADKDGCSLRPL